VTTSKKLKWAVGAAAFLLLTGYGSQSQISAAKQTEGNPIGSLVVPLIDSKGKVIGQARLTPLKNGVAMRINVAGLMPGLHGIHFHEHGKCDPSEFTTAGAHLNPYEKEHGFANPKGPHIGDLPNLVVKNNGTAEMEFITKEVNMNKGDSNSLLKEGGTSIIIHEKEDDLKTDPTGNSGGRTACGVIK
jgi:superoxide dismutase, Cu-Zn family